MRWIIWRRWPSVQIREVDSFTLLARIITGLKTVLGLRRIRRMVESPAGRESLISYTVYSVWVRGVPFTLRCATIMELVVNRSVGATYLQRTFWVHVRIINRVVLWERVEMARFNFPYISAHYDFTSTLHITFHWTVRSGRTVSRSIRRIKGVGRGVECRNRTIVIVWRIDCLEWYRGYDTRRLVWSDRWARYLWALHEVGWTFTQNYGVSPRGSSLGHRHSTRGQRRRDQRWGTLRAGIRCRWASRWSPTGRNCRPSGSLHVLIRLVFPCGTSSKGGPVWRR